MTLRRRELIPGSIADSVRQALLTGRVSESRRGMQKIAKCIERSIAFRFVEIDFGWREVEKAVEDSLTQQASRLMRK